MKIYDKTPSQTKDDILDYLKQILERQPDDKIYLNKDGQSLIPINREDDEDIDYIEYIQSIELLYYYDNILPDCIIAWTGWDKEEANTEPIEGYSVDMLIEILKAVKEVTN